MSMRTGRSTTNLPVGNPQGASHGESERMDRCGCLLMRTRLMNLPEPLELSLDLLIMETLRHFHEGYPARETQRRASPPSSPRHLLER
ncbi:hypothetical protein GCM10023166_22550 [Paeniglutamicibacter cryotolerans]|uniref:Uncharacterized protein n=1 Tax=Paeniglutamicibacter cryotolerans TaxID=670079 RepID=A0A839QT49_9MICC|nr:hypothetical protein [Paeniglutamicibacter cryotolerans]